MTCRIPLKAVNRPWPLLVLVMLSLSACVPSATGPADTFGHDFSLPPGSQTSGAVVFFVDGVSADIFEEMLDAGELPAIKRYFVDRGLYVRRAVVNTPSVTLANLTSFVTGVFPGHHGITGINWFDRNTLVWRNYETIAQKNMLDCDHISPTIYEHLRDRTTFSIFFQPHRGVTKFVENWTSAGPPYFFGWYEFVDRLTLYRLNIVADVARARRAWPAFTVAYLLAPDFRAYRQGVESPEYREALRHTDRQIGRVLGDLQRDGLLDDLSIAIVSDHGMIQVHTHWPVERFLRCEFGMKVATARLWENVSFEKRLQRYEHDNVVLYGSGDRYWTVNLRRPIYDDNGEFVRWDAWPNRPSHEDLVSYPTPRGRVDLLDILVRQEPVDAVAYAIDAQTVRVRRKSGEVEFRQQGRDGAITYRLVSGEDPLLWEGKVSDALLGGRGAMGRQWFDATALTEFPDLPAQILAYFRAHRAGDIALFATPGYDFATVHMSGHGGLRAAEMHVPMLLAGPGVPNERRDTARMVDMMPTLLKLLGRDVPTDIDGQPMID